MLEVGVQAVVLEVTPKKVFMIFVGENLWEKLPKKLFGQVWGNSGKNPSHSQKFACSYTYDEKTPQPPLPLF